MTTPGVRSTSDTARLMVNPPGFAIGWQQPVYLPDPAVGANWAYTVDGRYFERLLAVRYRFMASAVVATRFPEVVLQDTNGVTITAVQGGWTVPAGNTVRPNLIIGAPVAANATGGETFGYLPDILVPPGWSWVSSVSAMDPGDSFSQVVLLVQRFPNDAAAITAGE